MSYHHKGNLKGKITGGDGDIHDVEIEMWASGFLVLTGDGTEWRYKLESEYSIEEIESNISSLEDEIYKLQKIRNRLK